MRKYQRRLMAAVAGIRQRDQAALSASTSAGAQDQTAAIGEVVVTGHTRGIEMRIAVKRDSGSTSNPFPRGIGSCRTPELRNPSRGFPASLQRDEGRASAISLRGTEPVFTPRC